MLSVAFVALGWVEPVRAADDPEARWLHGYVLFQTGKELAEREMWPLAVANYSAALVQFQALSTTHPDFQRRLLEFRQADLKDRIARANESMNAGEHYLAMHYEGVIETLREGATRRYSLDFAAAYRLLIRAQWQMRAVLDQCPEPMTAALKDQSAWVDEMTEKTREDLIAERGGAMKVYDIEKDFAASESIALNQLPSFKSFTFEETETGMSSALFPEELVLRVRSEWYYY